jgi:hypothetical protein
MRTKDLCVNVIRVAFALTSAIAMSYQFGWLWSRPNFDPGNFFSFFTIQSNILAVAILVLTAILRGEERTKLFDFVRGGVTLYIAITGVVFALLLSGQGEKLDTHLVWVNFVVHYLIPIVVVADWLIDPPRHRASRRIAVAWLGYPAAWFAFTLIRGASVHWYPYPFVDVSRHGYGGVALNAAVLLVAFAAAAVVFVLIGNRRGASVPT